MDANALNLALAKWDGWTCRNCGNGPDDCTGCDFDDYPDYVLPRYTESLDAVAVLRKKLTSPRDRDTYTFELGELMRKPGCMEATWFDIADATALQHCEALARTLGIWEDEQ